MRVFDEIHEGLPEKEFPKSTKTIEKKFCRSTGKIAGPNCGSTGLGCYKISSMPSTCTSCTYNPLAGAVDGSGSVDNFVNNLGGVLNEIVNGQ